MYLMGRLIIRHTLLIAAMLHFTLTTLAADFKLKGKVVLDCHNICPLEGVYHI